MVTIPVKGPCINGVVVWKCFWASIGRAPTQRIKSLTVWWFPPGGGDDGDEEMLELNIKPALSPSPPPKLQHIMSGVVIILSEWGKHGAWDGQADRCGVSSDAGIVPDRCGEEGAEPEGQALHWPVRLRPDPHLWSWALGSDRKKEIWNTSGRNEFPP